MGTRAGEMREWLNRAASKAVELLVSSEGSNPSLSERGFKHLGLSLNLIMFYENWRGVREAEGVRLESV